MSEQPSHTESELVERLRSIDVRAPDELHRKVQALIDESERTRRRPRAWRRIGSVGAPASLRLKLGGAAAALAVIVAVLVASLSGGGSSAMNMREAAALTLRSATMAAPAVSHSNPRQLDVAVDGVAFPSWGERGWRPSGARVDRVGGRTVTTVFYSDGRGRRIGYAIVPGTAPALSGGRIAWRKGTLFRVMRANGAEIVTWLRDGHLCVVSGQHMDSATLLRLASTNDGSVAA
jgi:hypothetical protein